MVNSWKDFNVYEQIKSLKQILEPIVPDGDSFKIRGLLMRCVKYNLGIVKKLNKDEAKTLDLLLKNKMNPKTVYEWLLLEDAPAHIREKVIQRKIGLREGRRQFVLWRRNVSTRAGKELMEEIKRIIGGLRWKSQEGLKIKY